MKEKLTNNLWLKVCSLILAILLWLVCINSTDPPTTKIISVPVNYQNVESLQEEAEPKAIMSKDETIEVKVSGRESELQNITERNFSVVADVSKANRVGRDPLDQRIELEMVSTNLPRTVDWEYRYSNSVDIQLDYIKQKTFDLNVIYRGEVASGYQLNRDEIVISPQEVTLTGPESKFGNISSVGIVIDLSQFNSETNTVSLKPILYDANGNEVTPDESITFSDDLIKVSTNVQNKKTLRITFEGVEGEPAAGYYFNNISTLTETVDVAGQGAVLESLEEIRIPKEELDIAGATASKTFKIDITPYLQEGVQLLSSSNEIEVTVNIEKMKEKIFRISTSDIRLDGKKSGVKYAFASDSISFVLEGKPDVIDAFTSSNLTAYVDVSKLDAGTKMNLEVNLSLQSGVALKNPVTIQIAAIDPNNNTETPPTEATTSEPTDETSTAGSSQDGTSATESSTAGQ